MSALRLPVTIDDREAASGRLRLRGDAARYLLRVRRAAVGDTLVAFDPERAIELDARVLCVARDEAELEVGAVRAASIVPRRRVTLVQAVGKGDKLDQVVRDATELGATRIAPVIAARSVARREGDGARARLRKVAVEAARQCGRGDAPRVDAASPLEDVIASLEEEEVRVALVVGGESSLGEALRGAKGHRPVTFAVGPEGGFDDAERATLRSAGFTEVSLGPLVLRTETVCAAVLGALLATE